MQTEAATLQALAKDESRKSRSELARSVVRMFGRPELFLGIRERAIAYDILTKLILEIDPAVRRDIAAAVTVQRDAPRGLVRTLALDEIDIAFPILAQSPALAEADMIEVIRSRTIEHQLAIVDRPFLAESVSAALAATDDEEVVVALLRNKTATISAATMGLLVDRSRQIVSYRVPILDRDDLDSALATRMFFWVPTALCERIIAKLDIDPKTVDEMINQLVTIEVQRVAETKRSREDIAAELRTLMQREGRLTADMLIAVLREGEVPMFTSMFGKMIALNEQMIGRLLFEHDGRGLAVACRSVDIGRIGFISIFALAQKMRAESDDAIYRRLPAALDFYDLFTRPAANEVLERWRRGGDYAGAIRTIEYNLRQRRD